MAHAAGILPVAAVTLFTAATIEGQDTSASQATVTRAGSQAVRQGPAGNFTRQVTVTPLFEANDSAPYSGGYVTFAPGARSAWHTHPAGQRLVVTAGVGRTGVWGGVVQEIRAGDTVWCPPGVKHWHGAGPNSSMTHLALTGVLKGQSVVWMEKVTEAQYNISKTKPIAMKITQPDVEPRGLSPDDVRSVAPALERYTQERLYGELWNRPGLSKRDRSLVTVAAMIARGESGAMTSYSFGQALENGVDPREISETITHLAHYAGWGHAFAAIGPAKGVFTRRGIGPEQVPSASPALTAVDEKAEEQRAANVSKQFGAVAPGVVQYTTDYLFRDLWLRPDLAPRDRSLITVAALIASGQPERVAYHLNRAMDSGLTQQEASEMLTQLAFYAGWPRVFSAMPVVKQVFERRQE